MTGFPLQCRRLLPVSLGILQSSISTEISSSSVYWRRLTRVPPHPASVFKAYSKRGSVVRALATTSASAPAEMVKAIRVHELGGPEVHLLLSLSLYHCNFPCDKR